MAFYQRSLMDYDEELTQFRVHSTDLNAGNLAAQITLQSNLGTALNGVTKGTLQRIAYGNEVISQSPAPVDDSAQREQKWMVRYHDAITNKKYRAEIGTADTSLLSTVNKKIMDPASAEYIALVAAFEAFVTATDTDNAVVVDDIVLVHRNT
jgi:hypothetical protein